jgi:hypothetical protein
MPDGTTNRSGLIMSMHLQYSAPSEDEGDSKLCLTMGFEDGRVESWSLSLEDDRLLQVTDGRNDTNKKWEKAWAGKKHNEASE